MSAVNRSAEPRCVPVIGDCLTYFDVNPLEEDSLSGFKLHPIPITSMTQNSLEDSGLTTKEITRVHVPDRV